MRKATVHPIKKKAGASTDILTVWIKEMEALHRADRLEHDVYESIVNEQLRKCYAVEQNLVTSSMLFLFDNISAKYRFVSSTAESVLGYSCDEILDNGFEWIFTLLSQTELKYKNELMGDIYAFLATQKPESVPHLTVRYDIVGMTKNGQYKHFLEELMFPVTNDQGTPVLTTCFIHEIENYGTLNMRKCSINYSCKGAVSTLFQKTYPQQTNQVLSQRELEVLNCFARGMSTGETAHSLHLAINTIKTHRKNTFFKKTTDASSE